MKIHFTTCFLLILFLIINLDFILAEGPIPNLSFQLGKGEISGIIAIGVLIFLILIYWILQTRIRGFE